MPYTTMSVRIDKKDYDFVKWLATEEKEGISKAVRELLELGRVHLAIEEYKKGTASLGKASKLDMLPDVLEFHTLHLLRVL